MQTIQEYMADNKPALNLDKSTVMLLTKDDALKNNFQIELGGKTIRQSHYPRKQDVRQTYLGLTPGQSIDTFPPKLSSLSQDNYKIPGQRLQAEIYVRNIPLQITVWSGDLRKNTNTPGQGKLPSCPKGASGEICQTTPDKVETGSQWNSKKICATHLQTYKVLNTRQPEEMAVLMKMNTNGLRIAEHKKLDAKPKYLTTKKIIISTFHARSYLYNTLPKCVTTQPQDLGFGFSSCR